MAQLAHDIDHHEEHEHTSEATYVKIAIFLAVITIIEVAIYYIDWFHTSGTLVPSLLVLSAIKFYTVVAFFMHLKFDHKLLTFWFAFGLFLGVLIILSLMFLFDLSHPIDYATNLLRPLEEVLPGD
jgi:cytochrome c oxidase subunit IV